VRGIDPQLDGNAVRALVRKFRPAERQGEPVNLEAIVHGAIFTRRAAVKPSQKTRDPSLRPRNDGNRLLVAA
jgi:hypothetical protein